MQTAALRYHTNMDAVLLTAPYPAEGPPDTGIAEFYKLFVYFEWLYKRVDHSDGETKSENILLGPETSGCQIVEYVNERGPFDEILGFFQGIWSLTTCWVVNEQILRFIFDWSVPRYPHGILFRLFVMSNIEKESYIIWLS